eukprot:scaffold412_cov388-Prasinococcus_capsulatus_cf.AAC.10
MKNEIAVTRTATNTIEGNVSKLEKEKLEQDILIESMQANLKRLEQRCELFEAQRLAQAKQTKLARETLAQAANDMEAVNFEKKQLAQQWKSSLVAMARRDEALHATEEAVKELQERQLTLQGEIEGYRRGLKAEEDKATALARVSEKLDQDAKLVARQIQEKRHRGESLKEVIATHQGEIDRAQELERREAALRRKLEAESLELDRSIVKVNNSIHKMEAQLLDRVSEQMTLDKSVQKTKQATEQLRADIREQGMQSAMLQNEATKTQLNILYTTSHNTKLRETLNSLDDELQRKGLMIEKLELEIRRRNNEIEKQTVIVDRLNRQYDKITANMEDENTGPLEATIANLTKEVNSKQDEGQKLQRQWIGFQTELVDVVGQNNAVAEQVQQLKCEHAVLLQKRSRLDGQLHQHQQEIKHLNIQISSMHNEMTRLNKQIARNSTLQCALTQDNVDLETDIVSNLKALEGEASRMESNIDASKIEKQEILTSTFQAEAQVMLWERKIQLERETQATLDANADDATTNSMKVEVHRKAVRYDQLMKQQQKLVGDMGRAIDKRSFIEDRALAQAKKPSIPTEAALENAIRGLRQQVRQHERAAKASSDHIVQMQAEQVTIQCDINQRCSRMTELRSEDKRLSVELDVASKDRTKLLLRRRKLQRQSKHYEDLEAGKYRPIGTSDEVRKAIGKVEGQREKITSLVDTIKTELPHLSGEVCHIECMLE